MLLISTIGMFSIFMESQRKSSLIVVSSLWPDSCMLSISVLVSKLASLPPITLKEMAKLSTRTRKLSNIFIFSVTNVKKTRLNISLLQALNSHVHTGTFKAPFKLIYSYCPNFTIPIGKCSNMPGLYCGTQHILCILFCFSFNFIYFIKLSRGRSCLCSVKVPCQCLTMYALLSFFLMPIRHPGIPVIHWPL
jgi:hypothetical protein